MPGADLGGLSNLEPGWHQRNNGGSKEDREHERQQKRGLGEMWADIENVGGSQTQHERSDSEVRLINERDAKSCPTRRTLELKLERDRTYRYDRGTPRAAGSVFGHRR